MGRDIISLDDLTVNNIGVLKRINSSCLPTSYPDSWYESSLESGQIVKLAYYSELPVGAIRAKTINKAHNLNTYETTQQHKTGPSIIPNAVYIESFAVLKAYRNLGIGKKLLAYVIEETKKKFIHEITLHIHVENVFAQEWYEKQGFIKEETLVKDYYKEQGLPNPDAYVFTINV